MQNGRLGFQATGKILVTAIILEEILEGFLTLK
jgi:hypothetical protein